HATLPRNGQTTLTLASAMKAAELRAKDPRMVLRVCPRPRDLAAHDAREDARMRRREYKRAAQAPIENDGSQRGREPAFTVLAEVLVRRVEERRAPVPAAQLRLAVAGDAAGNPVRAAIRLRPEQADAPRKVLAGEQLVGHLHVLARHQRAG